MPLLGFLFCCIIRSPPVVNIEVNMGLFSAAEEAIFDKHRKEKELLVKIKQHSYLVWWSCVDVSGV